VISGYKMGHGQLYSILAEMVVSLVPEHTMLKTVFLSLLLGLVSARYDRARFPGKHQFIKLGFFKFLFLNYLLFTPIYCI